MNLRKKYPPSEPCSCDVCKSYCERPGWWTVKEAENAIRAGQGISCHREIEKEWNTPFGNRVIVRWGNLTGFWEKQGFRLVEKQ